MAFKGREGEGIRLHNRLWTGLSPVSAYYTTSISAFTGISPPYFEFAKLSNIVTQCLLCDNVEKFLIPTVSILEVKNGLPCLIAEDEFISQIWAYTTFMQHPVSSGESNFHIDGS